jgi:hypothetical protein
MTRGLILTIKPSVLHNKQNRTTFKITSLQGLHIFFYNSLNINLEKVGGTKEKIDTAYKL